jgi:metallo-beta-lactamase class B
MTAVKTPGHTKGCTTWTMTTGGKRVVFVCSVSAPGYKLKGNADYPEIVSDYRATFDRLDKLPCDVFLGSHGSFFHLKEKMKTRDFVDPEGYRKYLAESRAEFEAKLKAQ